MLLGGFPKAFRDLVSFFLLGVHNKAAFPDNDDDDDDDDDVAMGGVGSVVFNQIFLNFFRLFKKKKKKKFDLLCPSSKGFIKKKQNFSSTESTHDLLRVKTLFFLARISLRR